MLFVAQWLTNTRVLGGFCTELMYDYKHSKPQFIDVDWNFCACIRYTINALVYLFLQLSNLEDCYDKYTTRVLVTQTIVAKSLLELYDGYHRAKNHISQAGMLAFSCLSSCIAMAPQSWWNMPFSVTYAQVPIHYMALQANMQGF